VGQLEREAKDTRLLRVLADGHSRDMWAVNAMLPERWSIAETERVLDRLVQQHYVIDDRPAEVTRGATTMYAISGEGLAAVRRSERTKAVSQRSAGHDPSTQPRPASSPDTVPAAGVARIAPPMVQPRSAARGRRRSTMVPLLLAGGAALVIAAVARSRRRRATD
jgi:hypothetical protein